MDENLVADFLKKTNVFAVVGASRDSKKYGHQVYRDLRNAGYRVYPVNPNVNEVLGDKCYPSLEALPVKPDVVDVVVPPKVTEAVVKTCKKLGIRKVWMQPGSESEAAISFCRENGIDVVHGVCVMVERRSRQKREGYELEEEEVESWFSEFLGEGPSGHFMRRGETSPFVSKFLK